MRTGGIFGFMACGDIDEPHCWLLNGGEGEKCVYLLDHYEARYMLEEGSSPKDMREIFTMVLGALAT